MAFWEHEMQDALFNHAPYPKATIFATTSRSIKSQRAIDIVIEILNAVDENAFILECNDTIRQISSSFNTKFICPKYYIHNVSNFLFEVLSVTISSVFCL